MMRPERPRRLARKRKIRGRAGARIRTEEPSGLPAASIHPALSSVFAAPVAAAAEEAAGAGGSAEDGANPTRRRSPRTPPPRPHLARLIGVRSFVLPAAARGSWTGAVAAGAPLGALAVEAPAFPTPSPTDRATAQPAPGSVRSGELERGSLPGTYGAGNPAPVPAEAVAGGKRSPSGGAAAAGHPTVPAARTPTPAARSDARPLSPSGASRERQHCPLGRRAGRFGGPGPAGGRSRRIAVRRPRRQPVAEGGGAVLRRVGHSGAHGKRRRHADGLRR